MFYKKFKNSIQTNCRYFGLKVNTVLIKHVTFKFTNKLLVCFKLAYLQNRLFAFYCTRIEY